MINAVIFCTLLLLAHVHSYNFTTITIIGTNDIHGAAFPTTLYRSDTNETYSYGGLEYMAGIMKIIKD